MKMKNALTTWMIITSLNFSTFAFAEEVMIPVVAKPSVLQEGTQRDLTPEQVAELLPWAKNSRVFLQDLKSSVQGLSSADKFDRLESGIKTVVIESAPKHTELFMRYILNRSLAVNDTLKAEMESDDVGSIDTKLRVLSLSIDMAIKYYDLDMDVINKKTAPSFIEFGIEYFSFLSEINKSIFDASASYSVQRIALEWLQWDLYRDLNNQQMAAQIVKINNSLKIYPVKKMSDGQYLTYMKQMKLVAQQLDLKNASYQISAAKISTNTGVPAKKKDPSGLSSGYRANLISQCARSFSTESSRTMCSSTAIEKQLDLRLVEMCGSIMSTDSSRYECLSVIEDQTSSGEIAKAYKLCGTNLSENSSRLACMRTVNANDLYLDEISACGSRLSTNSTRLSCLETVGLTERDGSIAGLIGNCGSALSENSSRLSCIGEIANGVTAEVINACGSQMSTNSARLSCMKATLVTEVSQPEKIIKACGKLMSENSSRVACIEYAVAGDVAPSEINSCKSMTTNSSRLSCLSNY